MGKMLIPKPFIVVKILDSDRVLLDIIKSCLPWERGGGCGLGKKLILTWGQKEARPCSPRLSLSIYRQMQNMKITYKVLKTEHI